MALTTNTTAPEGSAAAACSEGAASSETRRGHPRHRM